MADLVRASSLVHIPELISAHGGSPDDLLAEAGIDTAIAGDYNRFIPYTALTTVVGRAAETLGVADFGLRVSRLQDLEMLGPIAVLARNSDNVESALLGVVKYLHTYSPAIKAELRTHARESIFTFEITLVRVPYREQMIEVALGVILGMFQLLAGTDFRPHRITFRHPRISAESVYIDYFRCPVHFDAPDNALVFPTGLLNRHLQGTDNLSYALANRYLGGQHRHLGVDEHVTELLGKLIALGRADLDTVARELSLHPRALQRRLADVGTSFEELLEDHRRSLALEFLTKSDLSMSDIARQLGYTEQSTFSRSCRRWFGKSPLKVRREERNGNGRGGPLPL